jgi:hypothetical protein
MEIVMLKFVFIVTGFVVVLINLTSDFQYAYAQDLPFYLNDRGNGQPVSMFGTYINKGELLIYPFFEYYLDNNMEYKPAEMGYGSNEDFNGKFRASEGLIFVSYGITDWLAIEIEAAVIKAALDKADSDTSAMPDRIEEFGTGDVEGQLRFRWLKESSRRPEIFSYFEAVTPEQKDKVLIGTPDWEFKFGSGVIKGHSWGTMTLRLAVEYSKEESIMAKQSVNNGATLGFEGKLWQIEKYF